MATAAVTSPKWKDLDFSGKTVFLGKLIVFLCSFGFVFPTLLSD